MGGVWDDVSRARIPVGVRVHAEVPARGGSVVEDRKGDHWTESTPGHSGHRIDGDLDDSLFGRARGHVVEDDPVLRHAHPPNRPVGFGLLIYGSVRRIQPATRTD